MDAAHGIRSRVLDPFQPLTSLENRKRNSKNDVFNVRKSVYMSNLNSWQNFKWFYL